jgi:hypothetical protein
MNPCICRPDYQRAGCLPEEYGNIQFLINRTTHSVGRQQKSLNILSLLSMINSTNISMLNLKD